MKLTVRELHGLIQSRLDAIDLATVKPEYLEQVATAFEGSEPTMLRLLNYGDGRKIQVIKVLRDVRATDPSPAAKGLTEELVRRSLTMPHRNSPRQGWNICKGAG